MGYFLQALIGPGLERHASDFASARAVPLGLGLFLVPLTDDLYGEIEPKVEIGGFEKLSGGVEAWAIRISMGGPVVYVEAEFFGGEGGQGAVAWSEGSRTLGPVHSQDAINLALRLLGVRAGESGDEFDAADLGRHRDTDDWLEPSA